MTSSNSENVDFISARIHRTPDCSCTPCSIEHQFVNPQKGYDVLAKRNMQQAIYHTIKLRKEGNELRDNEEICATFFKLATVDSSRNMVVIQSGCCNNAKPSAGDRCLALAQSGLSSEGETSYYFWDPELYLLSDSERQEILRRRKLGGTTAHTSRTTLTGTNVRPYSVALIPIYAEDEGVITSLEFVTLPGYGRSASLADSASFDHPEYLLFIGTSTGCVIIASLSSGVNFGLPSLHQRVAYDQKITQTLPSGRLGKNEYVLHNSIICVLKCNDEWCKTGRLPENNNFLLNTKPSDDHLGKNNDLTEALNDVLRNVCTHSPNGYENNKKSRKRFRDRLRQVANITRTATVSSSNNSSTNEARGIGNSSISSSFVRKFAISSYTPDVRNNPNSMKSSNTAIHTSRDVHGNFDIGHSHQSRASMLKLLTVEVIWIIFSDGFVVPLGRQCLDALCKGISEKQSWWTSSLPQTHADPYSSVAGKAHLRGSEASNASILTPSEVRPRLLTQWDPKTTYTPFAFSGISTLDENFNKSRQQALNETNNMSAPRNTLRQAAQKIGLTFAKKIAFGYLMRSATHQVSGDDAGAYIDTLLFDGAACARINSDPFRIFETESSQEQNLIVVGMAPNIASFSLTMTTIAEVTTSQIVSEVASKITSATIGFIKYNLWGNKASKDAENAEDNNLKRKTIDPPLGARKIEPFVSLPVGSPPLENVNFTSVEVDPSHRYAACYTPLGRVYIFDLMSGVICRIIKNCRAAECMWVYPTIDGKKMLLLAIHLNLRGVVELYCLNRKRRVCALRVGLNCTLFRADAISAHEHGYLVLIKHGNGDRSSMNSDAENESLKSFATSSKASTWESDGFESKSDVSPDDDDHDDDDKKQPNNSGGTDARANPEVIVIELRLKKRHTASALDSGKELKGKNGAPMQPNEKFKHFCGKFDEVLFSRRKAKTDDDASTQEASACCNDENTNTHDVLSVTHLIDGMTKYFSSPQDFLILALAVPVPATSTGEIERIRGFGGCGSSFQFEKWTIHQYYSALLYIKESLKSAFRPRPNDNVVIEFPSEISPLNLRRTFVESSHVKNAPNEDLFLKFKRDRDHLRRNYARHLVEHNPQITASQVYNFLELRVLLIKVYAEAGGRSSSTIRESLREMFLAKRNLSQCDQLGVVHKNRFPNLLNRRACFFDQENEITWSIEHTEQGFVSKTQLEDTTGQMNRHDRPKGAHKTDAFYASPLFSEGDSPQHGLGGKLGIRSESNELVIIDSPHSRLGISGSPSSELMARKSTSPTPFQGISNYFSLSSFSSPVIKPPSTKIVENTKRGFLPDGTHDCSIKDSAPILSMTINSLFAKISTDSRTTTGEEKSTDPSASHYLLDPQIVALCAKLMVFSKGDFDHDLDHETDDAAASSSASDSSMADVKGENGDHSEKLSKQSHYVPSLSLFDFLLCFWCGSYKIKCLIDNEPKRSSDSKNSSASTDSEWYRSAKVRVANFFFSGTSYSNSLVALSHLGISAQSASDLFAWWFIHDPRSQEKTTTSTVVGVLKCLEAKALEEVVLHMPLFPSQCRVYRHKHHNHENQITRPGDVASENRMTRKLFCAHFLSLSSALMLCITKACQLQQNSSRGASSFGESDYDPSRLDSEKTAQEIECIGSLIKKIAILYGIASNEYLDVVNKRASPQSGNETELNSQQGHIQLDVGYCLFLDWGHSTGFGAHNLGPLVKDVNKNKPFVYHYVSHRLSSAHWERRENRLLSKIPAFEEYLRTRLAELNHEHSQYWARSLSVCEHLSLYRQLDRLPALDSQDYSEKAKINHLARGSLSQPLFSYEKVAESSDSGDDNITREDLRVPIEDIVLIFNSTNPSPSAVHQYINAVSDRKRQFARFCSSPKSTIDEPSLSNSLSFYRCVEEPPSHVSGVPFQLIHLSETQFEVWILCQITLEFSQKIIQSPLASSDGKEIPQRFILHIDTLDQIQRILVPLLAYVHHKSIWCALFGAGGKAYNLANEEDRAKGAQSVFDCLLILATVTQTATLLLAPLRAAVRTAAQSSKPLTLECLQKFVEVSEAREMQSTSPSDKPHFSLRGATVREIQTYLGTCKALCEFIDHAALSDVAEETLSTLMWAALNFTPPHHELRGEDAGGRVVSTFIKWFVAHVDNLKRPFSVLTSELRTAVENFTVTWNLHPSKSNDTTLVSVISDLRSIVDLSIAFVNADVDSGGILSDPVFSGMVEWEKMYLSDALSLLDASTNELGTSNHVGVAENAINQAQARFEFAKSFSATFFVVRATKASRTHHCNGSNEHLSLRVSSTESRTIAVVEDTDKITTEIRPFFVSVGFEPALCRVFHDTQDYQENDYFLPNPETRSLLQMSSVHLELRSQYRDALAVCLFSEYAKKGYIREASHYWTTMSPTSQRIKAYAGMEVLRLWVFNVLHALRLEIGSANNSRDISKRTKLTVMLAGIESKLIGHMEEWISISELETGIHADVAEIALGSSSPAGSPNNTKIFTDESLTTENPRRLIQSLNNLWLSTLLRTILNAAPSQFSSSLRHHACLWRDILSLGNQIAHDVMMSSAIVPEHRVERVFSFTDSEVGNFEEFDVESRALCSSIPPLWREIQTLLRL